MRRFGFLLPLLVVAALPLPHLARHDPSGPDGLPPNDGKHPWKYIYGIPQVYTLAYSPRDVLPAALHQFQHDHWQIFTTDARGGKIVTLWKPMRHPLVRLFMGTVNARCTVTMQPLGRTGTRMVFQGDLASHRDLEGNPMLGTARHQYVKGARQYAVEVGAYLESHRAFSALTP